MSKLNGARADCASAALHQHSASFDRSRDVNGAMSGKTGNTETGALFCGNTVGKRHNFFQGKNDILGRGSEGAIGLRAVAPYATAKPPLRYPGAKLVDGARS